MSGIHLSVAGDSQLEATPGMGRAAGLPTLPIVIWAPDFDETSGGCIVLHALAFRLGRLGANVHVLTNLPAKTESPATKVRRAIRLVTYRLRLANRRRLARKRGDDLPMSLVTTIQVKCHASMPLEATSVLNLDQPFIAIYPEIISGNPFNAKHVVRWLLHRPGFFCSDVEFGTDEYTFFYQPAFVENLKGIEPDNLLRIHWMRDDIYQNRNLADRSGSCRMIRKGHVEDGVLKANDALLLDGKSHEEIAEIFNRTERFYCHDPYTLFVYYAALCGCTPIIVPQPGLTREDWRAGYEYKYGVAYGDDEYEWALATRDQLFAEHAAVTCAETTALQKFLSKLRTHFEG